MKTVDDRWAAFDAAYATKLAALRDDLAREVYRAKVVLDNGQHERTHAALKAWLDGKRGYITKKESIASSNDAQLALSVLSAYEREAAGQRAQVAPFKALGKDITTARYESKLSTYVFPDNAAVTAREKSIDDTWAEFDAAYATKLAQLNDDFARETFREKTEASAAQHDSAHGQLKAWIDSKEAYITKVEDIKNSKEATEALAVLNAFARDASSQKGQVAPLKALGKEITTARYETKLSTYTYPDNAGVTVTP